MGSSLPLIIREVFAAAPGGGFSHPFCSDGILATFGTPAWTYVAMSLFALAAFAVNWWFYWRAASPTHC